MFSGDSSSKSNYCAQHPNELLTNYCSNVNCKIGLCATCICAHTQSHLREGTEPIYSNIRDLQQQITQNLQEELENTGDILLRLNNVIEKIQNKELGLKEVMKTVREEAQEALTNVLASIEQKLHSEILSDAQKHGLHNQSRIENLTDKVKRERISLTQGIEEINQPDFVNELKRLTDTVLEGGRTSLAEIKSQICNNENYMTDIQFDRQSLRENLNRAIQNVVALSFTIPENMLRRQTQVNTQMSVRQKSESSRISYDSNAQSQVSNNYPVHYNSRSMQNTPVAASMKQVFVKGSQVQQVKPYPTGKDNIQRENNSMMVPQGVPQNMRMTKNVGPKYICSQPTPNSSFNSSIR